ncbi:MAG: serine hydrolase domain-containing protein [Rhodococcus fascians]|uniref:serine hydrolase domain-containing protein n=1 Tax=Nocardiaceae TaxID=85025 RepID=UPI0003803A84|nr:MULTISPECIES: serine hydrolase domain-containing protein [Rhodococcus]OZC85556.1 serine hydrolase [Rhodococcus sp. 06-418-1B]OZD06771.1 serine hydrolase [Rhodococcus sp. 06-156-4C]OZD20489.1 serine hydrolase [Rhodococcus sp. 06-156-3C]OZD27628.1 serine hydrolase [Rhodococcus sp. 06-156-4a]OZD35742.1 serine hydrolase [Rhodococcus sp. 06-156-3b]
MHSLDLIAGWPVDNASATVVSTAGTREHYGDQNRIYELASVTKLLVAYAALVALEEEAISLDLPAGPTGSTVRHLLAHTSGLAFAEQKVQADPGTKRIYSSAGFEVLADTIAAETSIAFTDYLDEAVFQPLGMTDSTLPGSAGHGARSTVQDLEVFASELLTPTLVSAETLQAATSIQFDGLPGILPGYGNQKPNDWGLGFELRDGKTPHWTGAANSPRTFGHFGQSGTFLWVDPDAGLATVVLTDLAFGEWAKPLWPELSDEILHNNPR